MNIVVNDYLMSFNIHKEKVIYDMIIFDEENYHRSTSIIIRDIGRLVKFVELNNRISIVGIAFDRYMKDQGIIVKFIEN